MKRNRALFVSQAAVIAALYVVLTLISNLFGLSSGMIQLRLSEALTILPVFTFSAVPGLFIGCILANLVTGCALWDVIFGSIATLIGALGTYYLRKHLPIALLSPVVANMLIVPHILSIVYGLEESIWFLMLTVGLGELASCVLLGLLLYHIIKKRKLFK